MPAKATARAPQRIRMRPSYEEVAAVVLEAAGTPMHYRQITEEVLRRRPMGGRTPAKTGYSVLFRSPLFRNVGGGLFDLKRKKK